MKKYHFILLLIISLIVVSCSKENPGDDTDDNLYNMVTFEKNTSEGSIFTYQGYDDSPIITLNAVGSENKNFRKGQRVMLDYYVTDRVSPVSQTIKVNYAVSTIFDSLRVATKEYMIKYPSNPIRLKSIWRTGEFININSMLQYSGKKRLYALVLDNATIDNAIAEAYLIDNLMGAEGYFYRNSFASFYIGSLWRRSTCKTLRIYLNDESFPDVKYYDFSKQQ